MATPIEEVVNIVLSIQSINIDRAGFGLPLILGNNPPGADLVSEYSSTKAYTDAGGLTTDAEYLALSAMFAQNPRPPKVLIGRRTNKPTMRWALTPVAANSTVYQLEVNGVTYSFTSDSSATASEINIGLKGLVDAASLPITLSDQTTYLRIVENVAGAWHKVRSPNTKRLGIAQDHADAGIAADLTAIQALRNDWYTLVTLSNSSAEIAAAAAWVEANKKLYIALSQDSAIINTVLSGATDIAATLKTAAYARTAVLYSSYAGSFGDAGWAGKMLPFDAGSEQWALKTLATVPVDALDDTQYNNAASKNANVYVTIAGKNFTMKKGVTASGEYIDVTRGSDAYKSAIQEEILPVLAVEPKQPFDDGGIRSVVGALKRVNSRFEDRKFLRAGKTTVTAPTADQISEGDRLARQLNGIVVSGQLAAAILSAGLTVTITP